jgi:hypothetical protein
MAWSKTKTTVAMSIVILIVVGAAIVTIQQIDEHRKNQQLASALLEMREEWARNGYHAKPLPKNLAAKGDFHGWSAGILGAYVEYPYRQDGLEGTRMFHILRADTNTTTWTLYDVFIPADTNLSQMSHRRTLTVVKEQP